MTIDQTTYESLTVVDGRLDTFLLIGWLISRVERRLAVLADIPLALRNVCS